MNVRFNRQEMAEILAAVGTVASTRTPKEILKCVSIEAHGDYVLLSATDLELGIRAAASQVEVAETGHTVVRADTLTQIVRESNEELLSFEREKNILHIRGKDSHFQIMTKDEKEFPPVPAIEGEPDFTIDQSLVRRLVEWTSFAAARESTRYAINGVLFEVKGEKLVLAATDGRRLASGKGTVAPKSKDLDLSIIVPTKALSLMNRIAADVETPVGFKVTGSQMLIQMGPSTISTSLVEGRFPNYQEVIPKDCDRTVEMDTLEFQSAIKRAALLTNEESKGVRLSFEEDSLTLSSRAPEQGEATISMTVGYKGEPLEIGFNPVFLMDVLRVAHSERLTLDLKESKKPGVIRVGPDLLYVVMPVNLS